MGFSAIVCVLSNNFHLQIWIFFSKWTTTTTIFFGSIFLMEITHIESALEMWGYSAESGSISSLKNTNVSSISVPILHSTHSLCLLWKKIMLNSSGFFWILYGFHQAHDEISYFYFHSDHIFICYVTLGLIIYTYLFLTFERSWDN